jgi:hypothetical protein
VVEQVLGRHLGSDEIVRHTCDNPPCFLYEHLRLGTQKDNIQDMIQKGRGGDHQRARGSKQGHAKLTETQVAEIKDLLGDGISPKEIGPRYGVGVTNIYNIKAGRAWRHV